MAYYHARANVCRAGVTYAGLANHPCVFSVGGSARTPLIDDFSVTSALDGSPSVCAFTATGFTPAKGNDVTITLGGQLIWGGTLTETRARAQKFVSGEVFWSCQAIDWTWLMDRYARVTLEAGRMGANALVAQILRDYTNGGFQTGHIPMELGDVGPFTFTGETVSGALRRIAAAANAYIRVRATKAIDLFQTLPISNALTLSNGSDIRGVAYEDSLSQVRTRTYYIGGGGAASALVGAGATTVPVDECGWYSGSQALAGADIFSYTGRTAASGPGSLTGCTGIAYDIPQGAPINVVAQIDDATAQTALATLLGGGRSGIAVGWFSDGRLSQNEVTARATADVAFYKSAIPAFDYTTSAKYHEPGKIVTASITDPVTVSGDFRIQRVTMRPFGAITGNTPTFEYQVQCRLARRSDVIDLLVAG